MRLDSIVFVSAVLALGGALAGCTSSTSGTDAGPTDAGVMDTGVMDTGVGDAGVDSGPADAGPTDATMDAGMMGMCTNASDEAVIMSQDVTAIATNCGLMCITSTNPNCTSDCIVMQTGMPDGGLPDGGSALSAACAMCYQDVVQCAATHCFSECSTAPDGMACLDCRCGRTGDMVNCEAMYTTCSGIPATACSM